MIYRTIRHFGEVASPDNGVIYLRLYSYSRVQKFVRPWVTHLTENAFRHIFDNEDLFA